MPPTAEAKPELAARVVREAPVERVWLDDTSWIDLARGFAQETDALFEHLLREVRWRQNREIRGGRPVDDPRLDGSMPRVEVDRHPFFRRATLVLEARYRVRLTGIHFVLYRDGRDGMGFHRDTELRYLENTVIAGLAFGATRSLALRSRFGGTPQAFEFAAGDLYVMGGRCQEDWMHGVPKVGHAAPKISAVWRWTSKRGRPEPPYTPR